MPFEGQLPRDQHASSHSPVVGARATRLIVGQGSWHVCRSLPPGHRHCCGKCLLDLLAGNFARDFRHGGNEVSIYDLANHTDMDIPAKPSSRDNCLAALQYGWHLIGFQARYSAGVIALRASPDRG